MEDEFKKRRKGTDSVNHVETPMMGRIRTIPRFGPLPTFPHQRIWTRIVLIICAAVIVYFSSVKNKETVFVSQKYKYEKKIYNLPCSESYKFELTKFKGCVPESCGRVVSDTLISNKEVEILLNVAETGIALAGSEGGASILDLHSGALSHGQNFVDFYKLPESSNIFKKEDYMTYFLKAVQHLMFRLCEMGFSKQLLSFRYFLCRIVKNRIQEAVAQHFGIKSKSLYLTHPTFFSRLTNTLPKTTHDEYWHKHVDKETYESFHYTSLVYLTDYGKDFLGGRFFFINSDNSTSIIEPKRGRVSMFTSGAENPHYVEKVSSGSRFAITISFTCDSTMAVTDFKFMAP